MDRKETLLKAGGRTRILEKGEILYLEGEIAYHLYVVGKGKMKIVNIDDEGREFIQDFVTDNMSFGAVALFNGGKFPASAIAAETTEIISLEKSLYLELLKKDFDFHYALSNSLALRLRMQINRTKQLGLYQAKERILGVLNRFKKDDPNSTNHEFLINLSRKEIAKLTGLRTETVIRTIKKMQKEGLLDIKNQKIIYTAS